MSSSTTTSSQTSLRKHDDLHLLTQLSSSPRNSNPSTPIPQSTDPSGPLTPDAIHLINPFAALATTNLPLLPSIRTIGEYELSETKFDDFKCARHIPTGEALLYKEFSLDIVRQRLEPYQRLLTILQLSNKNSQLTLEQLAYKYHIHFFRDILSLDRTAIVLYPNYTNNLHQYITERHRLNENETRSLFSQIVRAVQLCHRVGLIVRDLKLRKIIFNDNNHTHLLLTGIDESIMLSTPTATDDLVSSRFSCPVYACPEIVLNRQMYSGKMADSWSLGTSSFHTHMKAYTNYVFRYHFIYHAFWSLSFL
jgi:serine/threonine protein kinase